MNRLKKSPAATLFLPLTTTAGGAAVASAASPNWRCTGTIEVDADSEGRRHSRG